MKTKQPKKVKAEQRIKITLDGKTFSHDDRVVIEIAKDFLVKGCMFPSDGCPQSFEVLWKKGNLIPCRVIGVDLIGYSLRINEFDLYRHNYCDDTGGKGIEIHQVYIKNIIIHNTNVLI